MILHAKYSDGKNIVHLNDVCIDKAFVLINGDLFAMALSTFLRRFKLISSWDSNTLQQEQRSLVWVHLYICMFYSKWI